MKKIHYLFILLILVTIGCKNNTNIKTAVHAHGRSGDIIVVMNNERWNSESGDTLRAVFNQYVPNLPMEEPLFDLHQIPRDKFSEINMFHKNIIFQEINPDAEEASIKLTNDKYARNQVFVHIIARNQAEFVQLVSQYRDKLVNIFLNADNERWIKQITTYTNKVTSDKLLKAYDIAIKIPKNYYVDVLNEDFAWISNDTRKYSMNILAYTYPIEDSTEFTTEYLISKRDEILKENVPGSRPGSYMTTEVKYDYPSLEVINHNGLETATLHGLWKVKGDFMGGPFVSYTKLDKPRKRVVAVEGFVYHPNEEVRDQIRQLEGVLSTFDLVK